MLVGDMISSTAFRFPHRTGIVDEHGMRLTWQQMDSRINSLAHAFIEMGIKRQETVAMLAENCAQYAEFLFAAAKSNTIAAGLNYRLTPEQLLIQIDDCRPKAIIVQKKYAELIEPIISRLKEVKVFIGFGEGHRFEHDYETLIKKFPATEPDVEIDENDIHTITYTSGTTGAPKAVVVTHRTQVARAIQMNFALRFTPEETIISSLPMYAFGGQMPIFTYTMIGATIVSLVLKGKSLVELTESERVTTHFLTPSRLKMMKDYVAESDREYDLSSVRKVVVSNQAAYEDDLRELVNFFPALEYSGILRGFGSSETGLY
ncbi:MAG: AMP-binding protein, partial [Chloroflexota bacterium]|nr:AMP-binding protein [Chloroflexota bacterium]